jgi:hypothetical protein
VYFVSNINGAGTARDNKGYVSRVAPDGTVTVPKFLEGGRSGVILNAPKGLAILGDESAATMASFWMLTAGWSAA